MRLSLQAVLLCSLFVIAGFSNLQAFPVRDHLPAKEELSPEEQKIQKEFEEKISRLSTEKQAKVGKKLNRIKKKIDKRNARLAKKGKKTFDQVKANSGVGTGLLIVLIGVLIAILGFAGIADILITIGLVVLVIGLILWLAAQF